MERRVLGSIMRVAGSSSVSLTFDDGPHPDVTPAVLELLARHGARGTFFVLTEPAREHRSLLAEIVAAGHEIALHGANHARLTGSKHVVRREIVDAKHELEELLGSPVRWFRPSFGEQTKASFVVARRAGLDVVLWSVDTKDYMAGDVDQRRSRILGAIEPGAIVLAHDVPTEHHEHAGRDEAKLRYLEWVLDTIAEVTPSVIPVDELVHSGRLIRQTRFHRPTTTGPR